MKTVELDDIRRFFVEDGITAAETATPESTFAEIGVDSLDAVNVSLQIEDEYKIDLTMRMLDWGDSTSLSKVVSDINEEIKSNEGK